MTMSALFKNSTIETMDTPSGTEVSLVAKPFNPKNGLTNGIVCRATTGNKNRFVFSLQTGHTHERQKRTNIFVAQRKICSKFYIFDVTKTVDVDGSGSYRNEAFSSKNDDRFVGEVCRIRKFSDYIGYSLFQGHGGQKHQVQSVLYQIPKTLAWMKGETFRECHVIFASEVSLVKSVGSVGDNGPGKLTKTMDNGRLKQDVRSVLTKKKTIQEITDLIDGIHVTTTKIPKYNHATKSFTTNFAGRCQKNSQINMQLADGDDSADENDKKINLQIAFWTNDEYSVDFTDPISPFQAFGFALAQFNL